MDENVQNHPDDSNDVALESTAQASPICQNTNDIRDDRRNAASTPTSFRKVSLSTVFQRLHRSMVVDNQGNVARDHLSAERTFLAYVRTALVCVTAGVGVVQLLTLRNSSVPRRLHRFGKVLGSVTEAFAVAVLIIAVYRYFTVQKSLLNGTYPAAQLAIWTIATVFTVLIIIAFGLMLAIAFS